MPDLSTTYCGIAVRNPVVLASAGTSERAEQMKRAADAGVGAIVMKSCFEHAVSRVAPTPRFRLINRGIGGARSVTFYSYEQASTWGPERYAEEVERARGEVDVPVFASINCESDAGWRRYARRMEDAGASAIEMNVSCPHGSIAFTGQMVLDRTLRAVNIVLDEVKIPVAVKMTPQSSTPVADARTVAEAGPAGLVAFNRFTGLDIDVNEEKPILHRAYAGHGGAWALQYTLRWVSAMTPEIDVDVAASGGITGGEDVVKCLLAGARVAEVCTAVYLEGYDAITRTVNEIDEWMRTKGYRDLNAFRGKVTGSAILDTDEVHRSHDRAALIDPDRCISCGRCGTVCLYSAVKAGNGHYEVLSCCDGCGMCVEVCPAGAIRMQPTQEGDQ